MKENRINEFQPIALRVHPRVFSALGSELVTNDVVAVIELVKNSYDAFAENVRLRFSSNAEHGAFLEIEDDGFGMSKEVITDVWCTVATPYKEYNTTIEKPGKKRRVVGEKGLGRLAAARLGSRLHMLTQAPGEPCWEVIVDWQEISRGNDISESFARCRRFIHDSPFRNSGTRIRILSLNSDWDEDDFSNLEDNLARLISPFSDLGDFCIRLSTNEGVEGKEVRIDSPEFLLNPKYMIKGFVDSNGSIQGIYRFNPIKDGESRTAVLNLPWHEVTDYMTSEARKSMNQDSPHCGPFQYEIRSWDIGAEDTAEIEEAFNIRKSIIRSSIRSHKGISVYRNDVLVLPKSENSRDWLGLDLRRVSRVGTRLSTSQVVGYVSISAEDNPKIGDTSDRERLVSCQEVIEFEEIIKVIVYLLEGERDRDRLKPSVERPMDDLFGSINANDILAEVTALSDDGANFSDAIPFLRDFSKSLDTARETIQKRFVYYSRLATIGTISQMLVHEIRSRTTAFGSFLEFMKSRFGPFKDEASAIEYRHANTAVDRLEGLADKFAPLASRKFNRGKRQSNLEDEIKYCLELHRADLKASGVACSVADASSLNGPNLLFMNSRKLPNAVVLERIS